MNRWSDGLGRTIVIAAIAGSLFAAFLALAPRLTASESPEVVSAPDTSLPGLATSSLPGLSDPVVAVPAPPPDVEVTVTTEPAAPLGTTVTSLPAATTTSTTTVPDPGVDGTIELTVEARNADDADSTGVLVEGDEIQWRFRVTNASNEELWGAYVYLELHGPAMCEETNLRPGEFTDCWIATRAVEGSHTAEAWSTAWTTDRIVKANLDYVFQVSL